MRTLTFVSIAFLTFPLVATASPQVATEAPENIEALANQAPDRVQGFRPNMHDLDQMVDRTTGHNLGDPDDCSRVPVLSKGRDGKPVRQLIDMCD